jgi:phage terminase small subunit
VAKGLTVKQRRFVEAYMGKAMGNATEAARLAGYKGNRVTLAKVGEENLKKPQIKKAITALQKRETKRARKTRDDILESLERDIDQEENAKVRHSAIDLWNKMQGHYNHTQRVEFKDLSAPDRAIRVREIIAEVREHSD